MKKLLPKTANNPEGFTLIELLVVIAIIAVLAVMGFAAFRGLTGRGNDARRRADIKAIADALEVARSNNPTYVTVAKTAFSGGTVPSEPTTRLEKYCYLDGTTGAPPADNPVQWAAVACPPLPWVPLDGVPSIPVTANAIWFRVCTDNEAISGVICASSRQ